jgi:hypothetical protein
VQIVAGDFGGEKGLILIEPGGGRIRDLEAAFSQLPSGAGDEVVDALLRLQTFVDCSRLPLPLSPITAIFNEPVTFGSGGAAPAITKEPATTAHATVESGWRCRHWSNCTASARQSVRTESGVIPPAQRSAGCGTFPAAGE